MYRDSGREFLEQVFCCREFQQFTFMVNRFISKLVQKFFIESHTQAEEDE